MIIYTCPQCGTDLIEAIATTSIPPQRQFLCPSCGWQHWHEGKEEIIRIPYGGNGLFQPPYEAYEPSALGNGWKSQWRSQCWHPSEWRR